MSEQTQNTIGHELKAVPPNKAVRLANVVCPYCGAALTKETRNKEHVIGRRFVPKGKLHGNWNLIVNACRTCNGLKADLEDDIAAITMQPDTFGRFGHDDPSGAAEAARKAAKSYSRRTKKLVKDSHEQMTITMPFGTGATFKFGFTGPAQLDRDRIFELARLQVAAFFFWITYKPDRKRGYWWPGGFYPVLEASRGDWGNPVHQAFSEAVVDWEPRVMACNADGFFKLALRKHPDADCWSWALEWNHALRVIGFCGNEQAARDVAKRFPKLQGHLISQGENVTIGYRTETPLPDDADDKVFYWRGANE